MTNSTRTLIIKSFIAGLLAVVSLILLRPLITGFGKDKAGQLASSEKKPAALPTGDLAIRINSLIEESESTSGRWGICVISMTDGSVVFERNSDKLFTPASNMKIYTTGVALDLL